MLNEPWVQRPWGRYKVLIGNSRFWLKIIQIEPWARTSLQRHSQRSELWIPINKLQMTHGLVSWFTRWPEWVPKGRKHRLSNHSARRVYLLEIALGRASEVDCERLQDDYGRL